MRRAGVMIAAAIGYHSESGGERCLTPFGFLQQTIAHEECARDRSTAAFQSRLCPIWVIHVIPAIPACPLRSRKRPKCCGVTKRRYVPHVWPGRAVQDGLPRSTNVRAASMYQASGVEQFAPGRHGYPRASDGPRDRNGGRVSDIAPAMAAKPVSRTITSRLASNSSCAWACSVL